MENEQKQYVPKSGAKLVPFPRGGHIIKLGFHAETLMAFVKANQNERGYINLIVAERRAPSPHGDTHSIYLDTWKPKAGGGTAPRPQPPATKPDGEAPPEDDAVPF